MSGLSSHARSRWIALDRDGSSLRYGGTGRMGGIRALHPITTKSLGGWGYFEVELNHSVDSDVTLVVGLVGSTFDPDAVPVDECYVVASTTFDPMLSRGDAVGCVVDFVLRNVQFSVNGSFMDVPPLSIDVPPTSLYPCLWIRAPGAFSARVRLSGPFRASLRTFAEKRYEALQQLFQRACDPATAYRDRVVGEWLGEEGEEGFATMDDARSRAAVLLKCAQGLVEQYLAAGAYSDELTALIKRDAVIPPIPLKPDAMVRAQAAIMERQKLRRALTVERRAMEAFRGLGPGVDERLRFDVGCIALVQMCRLGNATPASCVSFARAELFPMCSAATDDGVRCARMHLLEESLGLLSFAPGPERDAATDAIYQKVSPAALAMRANAQMLPKPLTTQTSPSMERMTALERLVRHQQTLLSMLAAEGSPHAATLLSEGALMETPSAINP